jgi:hypothetical protein
MAINTLLFIALHLYILRRLLKPELVGRHDPHIILKSLVGPFSYLIGAAAAWFSVHAAFIIYMITPFFFIVPPQWHGVAQTGVEGGVAERRP